MKNYRIVLLIGIIEVLIGFLSLLAVLGSVVLSLNNKTLPVLSFVIITSIMSFSIGVGILRFKKLAYRCLLYFSSVIILIKFLMIINIIQLNGTLTTFIPNEVKTAISIFYHGFIVYYLLRPGIKQIFHK